MNRRDVLTTAAGSLAVLSLSALAEEAKAPPAAPAAAAGKPKDEPVNMALYEAALGCLKAGDICLDHCVRSLSTGDKMMAECAATVRQMLPMCKALSELTLQRSAHLKALAVVCAQVCRDCEAACKKHAGHHAECKGCLESCQRCASECEKLA
jgi:Cys-rich four helix bundle protein (predicted Tat secretion target)